ncbi:hypothetical protein [Symbiobacterium terraclitae]|uniref:hypothetical protein n=1 Tax=Symbiobacterium terraclitae TaxID=557451 RepID=UPI0035B56E3F
MRRVPKPRPPLMRPCTERAVLTSLHHAMYRCGIPVKYWDREDMICGEPLVREMRRVIWREWLCLPVIVEGMTVGEIVRKVVWAHHGGFERRSG